MLGTQLASPSNSNTGLDIYVELVYRGDMTWSLCLHIKGSLVELTVQFVKDVIDVSIIPLFHHLIEYFV